MIQRVLTLFLILSLQLWAIQYKPTVLELEAKLFPKMVLLNTDIDKSSDTLQIYIIIKEWDLYTALELQKDIELNYPDKISGKKIVVSVEEFQEFQTLPDAIIVLHHNSEELTKIANWANKHKIISLAYDPSYMQYGILASLYLGKATKPYLNKKIITKYGFKFSPYLLKLSKFK